MTRCFSCLQTEDHELWVAHFDSLQRRPPLQTAAPSAPPPGPSNGSERGEWEPSSSLSLVWEAMSSCGADSVCGASVDTSSGFPTRARYSEDHMASAVVPPPAGHGYEKVFFVILCLIQLSEDHDRLVGPHPDRGEREEEAQTAGAAGRSKKEEGQSYFTKYLNVFTPCSPSSSEQSKPRWRSEGCRGSETRQGGGRRRRRKRGGWHWRERCWRDGTSWTH